MIRRGAVVPRPLYFNLGNPPLLLPRRPQFQMRNYPFFGINGRPMYRVRSPIGTRRVMESRIASATPYHPMALSINVGASDSRFRFSANPRRGLYLTGLFKNVSIVNATRVPRYSASRYVFRDKRRGNKILLRYRDKQV